MKEFITTVFLVIVVIGLFIWFAVGGSKTITRGTYGPFEIGDSKENIALSLREMQLWPAEPLPAHDTFLKNPQYKDLIVAFGADEGIQIWFGLTAGVPMRLELEEDKLVAAWPKFQPKTWTNPNPGYDEIDAAMLDLQDDVSVGMTRQEVFQRIGRDESGLSVHVGPHVAGWQKFDRISYEETRVDPAYSDFVFSKQAWRFTGLHDVVWYSFFRKPDYSSVTLYFKDDVLETIVHFHGPFEMP